jgi:hypothetical protein
LIRNDIKRGCRSVSNECKDILWIRLDKTYFRMKKDIYIAMVYFSSTNLDYCPFDELEKKIEALGKLGEVVIGGDFNA